MRINNIFLYLIIIRLISTHIIPIIKYRNFVPKFLLTLYLNFINLQINSL